MSTQNLELKNSSVAICVWNLLEALGQDMDRMYLQSRNAFITTKICMSWILY